MVWTPLVAFQIEGRQKATIALALAQGEYLRFRVRSNLPGFPQYYQSGWLNLYAYLDGVEGVYESRRVPLNQDFILEVPRDTSSLVFQGVEWLPDANATVYKNDLIPPIAPDWISRLDQIDADLAAIQAEQAVQSIQLDDIVALGNLISSKLDTVLDNLGINPPVPSIPIDLSDFDNLPPSEQADIIIPFWSYRE